MNEHEINVCERRKQMMEKKQCNFIHSILSSSFSLTFNRKLLINLAFNRNVFSMSLNLVKIIMKPTKNKSNINEF